MRRMILQKFITWCENLFPFVHQKGTTTEVGGNLEVDGNLDSNAQVYDLTMSSDWISKRNSEATPYNKAIIKNGILYIMITDALAHNLDTTSTTIATLTLPSVIGSKIHSILSNQVMVFGLFSGNDNSPSIMNIRLAKSSDTDFSLIIHGQVTITDFTGLVSGRGSLTL